MSEQVARAVIDSLEFARTRQTLSGSVPVGEFVRLHDCLYDTIGQIDFRIEGGADERRRPVLRLKVGGRLHLRCQRCLGRLDFGVDLDSTLVLQAWRSRTADDVEDDDSEMIDPDPQLDVAALVEDELILGIPYSPRHGEGECLPEGAGETLSELGPAMTKRTTGKLGPN